MTDRDDNAARLRDRAARLFALALKAREDGNDRYAEELAQLASEAIDWAADVANGAAANRADKRQRRPASRTTAVRPFQEEQADAVPLIEVKVRNRL